MTAWLTTVGAMSYHLTSL